MFLKVVDKFFLRLAYSHDMPPAAEHILNIVLLSMAV